MPAYKAANNISYTRLDSTDLAYSSVNYTIHLTYFKCTLLQSAYRKCSLITLILNICNKKFFDLI